MGIIFWWVTLGHLVGELRPERSPNVASGLEFSNSSVRLGVGTARVNEGGRKGRRETSGRASPVPAGRRRYTSGIPGLLAPRLAPVLLLSHSTRPALLEAELLCQVVVFRDAMVGLTRGRAVGGTSGPQSGQMFPGRLPATYLTSPVGDAARGRNRTAREPGRAAVRNPG